MSEDIICFETEEIELGFSKNYIVSIVKGTNKSSKRSLTVVEAKDDGFNREVLERGKAHILIGLEKKQRKDFMHHRNSGLNQVLCKLAKKKKVAIGFSFSEILNARDRPQLLGRMMQNIKLCRKYKVKIVFATFAKNKWEMRAASDMLSLGRVIGMNPGEAKSSLDVVKTLLKKDEFVKGVKIIE